MKKLILAFTLASIALLPLSASPSRVGVQGFSSHTSKTTTYTTGVVTYKEKSTADLGGINIAGSFYPGDSSFGIGAQFGAAKLYKATNGSSEEDVSDYPLTWRGGASALYHLGMSDKSALEFGMGLLFERMTICEQRILRGALHPRFPQSCHYRQPFGEPLGQSLVGRRDHSVSVN